MSDPGLYPSARRSRPRMMDAMPTMRVVYEKKSMTVTPSKSKMIARICTSFLFGEPSGSTRSKEETILSQMRSIVWE